MSGAPGEKSVSYYNQKAELPGLKVAFPEFAGVHSQVLQHVITRVDTAYQRFFDGLQAKRKVGYPRFKAATQYHSFTYPQYDNGIDYSGEWLAPSLENWRCGSRMVPSYRRHHQNGDVGTGRGRVVSVFLLCTRCLASHARHPAGQWALTWGSRSS